jgi:hypothetical protein
MSVRTANLLVGIWKQQHISLKQQYQLPDCDIWLLDLECETGVPTAWVQHLNTGSRVWNRGRLHLKCDGTGEGTRLGLSGKWTSPFTSVGPSVQSTAGSRGVRISGSNAGYTMFRGSVKSTGYPIHSAVSPTLPPCASPCAITFQLDSTNCLTATYEYWIYSVKPPECSVWILDLVWNRGTNHLTVIFQYRITQWLSRTTNQLTVTFGPAHVQTLLETNLFILCTYTGNLLESSEYNLNLPC